MEARPHAPWVAEDLLSGARILRQAFLEAPAYSADRGRVLVAANDPEPPVLLIHRGFAYRSLTVPDGRRAIIDVFLPTDIAGVDHVVAGPSEQQIIAASPLGYRALGANALRKLMRNDEVAMRVFALLAEQRRQLDRHAMTLARLNARERICAFVIGVHDRLRRSGLISRPTFNLPLNQDQIADHLGITMVHVSRTLRRLREERLLLVERQVAIIIDIDGVRDLAKGSAPAVQTAGAVGAHLADDSTAASGLRLG